MRKQLTFVFVIVLALSKNQNLLLRSAYSLLPTAFCLLLR